MDVVKGNEKKKYLIFEVILITDLLTIVMLTEYQLNFKIYSILIKKKKKRKNTTMANFAMFKYLNCNNLWYFTLLISDINLNMT